MSDVKEFYKNVQEAVASYSKGFYEDRSVIKDRLGNEYNVSMFGYAYVEKGARKHPYASHIRDIVFLMDDNWEPVKVLVRPYKKFYSWNENETMQFPLKKDDIVSIYEKLDGGLIVSYSLAAELHFKTPRRYGEDITTEITNAISKEHSEEMVDLIKKITNNGYTVCLEYTSPLKKNLIDYGNRVITIISINDTETGEVHSLDSFIESCRCELTDSESSSLYYAWADRISNDELDIFTDKDGKEGFAECLKKVELFSSRLEGVEGYVLHSKEHGLIKLKTNWYTSLHAIKGHSDSFKQMCVAVTEGWSDDVKALIMDQRESEQFKKNVIVQIEEAYSDFRSSTLKELEDFYNEHKHLSRREYHAMLKWHLEKPWFDKEAMKYYTNDKSTVEKTIKQQFMWNYIELTSHIDKGFLHD